MKVEFKFELDQMVLTPTGNEGIVQMLGRDGEGNKYYVSTSSNDTWYKEKHVKACEITT